MNMYLILVTLASLIFSPFLIGNDLATFVLVVGQFALLLGVILEKHLTGAGAFLFMSFLFFGIRPIYISTERDYSLLQGLFRVSPTITDLNATMWWATACMLAFRGGIWIARNAHADRWWKRGKEAAGKEISQKAAGYRLLFILLVYQIGTVGIMHLLAGAGKSLYESALGAYIYDLPAVMQAGHAFALLVALERWLKNKSIDAAFCLAIAGILFLLFTLKMRDISMFRGFYLTGLMAGGIAVLARLRPKVRALWLILPILILLPAFRMLGELRYADNPFSEEEISMAVDSDKKSGVMESYWDFYDSKGDMNIFDTFLAARLSTPKKHPYLLSWLYVPVHFVPRAIWKSKPERGILVDVDFMNGAPYSPGILGFFFLDGGYLWMILCMTTLGYLMSILDLMVLTMPRSYLRFCLYGVIVVNALGLSRYYLWQYFYGVVYSAVPCFLMAKYVQLQTAKFIRGKKRRRFRGRKIKGLESSAEGFSPSGALNASVEH